MLLLHFVAKKCAPTEILLNLFQIVEKKHGFYTIFTSNQVAINFVEKSYTKSPIELQTVW